MKSFFSIVIREIKSLRKEKTILFAILIQFFIASFSSVILLGIMVYYDPSSIGHNARVSLNVGVLGDSRSRFVNFLESSNHRVFVFNEPDKAESAFKAGKLDTIVFIPDADSNPNEMKIVLPDMDAQATLVLMLLKEPLERYEDFLRQQQGVFVRYQDVTGKPFTTNEFFYTIILPVLMLFPAFIAGSMVIDSICEEIENKTLDTLLSTPISLNRITSAKIIAALVVGLLQGILWLILLGANGFIIHNPVTILLLATLITAIISTLALIVALNFRDRERSQFIYSLLILLLFSLSYFLNPSPFSLIARLATGDPWMNYMYLLVYLAAAALLAVVPPLISKRLMRG
jgi:hypothetical protein